MITSRLVCLHQMTRLDQMTLLMFLWLSSCALMVDGVIHLSYRHHYREPPSPTFSTSYIGFANSDYDVLLTFNSSSGYTAEFPVTLDTGSQPFNVLGYPLVINGSTCSYYQGDCYTDSYMVNNYGSGGSNGSVCVNGSASVGLGELSAEPISFVKIFYALDIFHSCSTPETNRGVLGAGFGNLTSGQPSFFTRVVMKCPTVWARFPFLMSFSGSTVCQTYSA